MNKFVSIAGIMLVLGFYFSTTVTGLGLKEWSILTTFVIVGLGIGSWQAMVITRKRQGKLSAGKSTAYVILSIVIFVALKVTISSIIHSNLKYTGNSFFIQICFTIFGIFMARGVVTLLVDNKSANQQTNG